MELSKDLMKVKGEVSAEMEGMWHRAWGRCEGYSSVSELSRCHFACSEEVPFWVLPGGPE